MWDQEHIKEAVAAMLQEEIHDRLTLLRQAVTAGDIAAASRVEGAIKVLEDLPHTFERNARKATRLTAGG